jgi:hypothetical protein
MWRIENFAPRMQGLRYVQITRNHQAIKLRRVWIHDEEAHSIALRSMLALLASLHAGAFFFNFFWHQVLKVIYKRKFEKIEASIRKRWWVWSESPNVSVINSLAGFWKKIRFSPTGN